MITRSSLTAARACRAIDYRPNHDKADDGRDAHDRRPAADRAPSNAAPCGWERAFSPLLRKPMSALSSPRETGAGAQVPADQTVAINRVVLLFRPPPGSGAADAIAVTPCGPRPPRSGGHGECEIL